MTTLNEWRGIGRLKDDPTIETTERGYVKVSFVLVIDRPRYDPERASPRWSRLTSGGPVTTKEIR